MTIPVTVIGSVDDDSTPRATDQNAVPPSRDLAHTPTTIAQRAAAPAPDSHAPAKAPSAPIAVSRIHADTTEPLPAVATPPAGSAPLAVTALGGAAGKPNAVPIETIARRFPETTPEMRARVRALLLGQRPAAATDNGWLTYGVAGQTAVNATLKTQIALLDASDRRDATALLARLHAILAELLGALEGGFFRRSAHAAWQHHAAEIRHIEARLAAHANALLKTLDALGELDGRYGAAHDELEAFALAGTFTLDNMTADDNAQWLQSRLIAITASQQLAQQNRLLLVQQNAELRELVTLLQDGVLVKLPAVSAQLTTLPDKPNETERYLAREALGALAQLFERTRKWHSS